MSLLTQSSQCWGKSAPLPLPLWFPPDQRPSRFPHRLSSSFYGFLPMSVLQLSSQALLIPLWFPPDQRPSCFPHRLSSSLCGFLPTNGLPAFLTCSPLPFLVSSRPMAFPLSSQALLIPLWLPSDQWTSRFPHTFSSSLCGFLLTSGLFLL